MATTLPQIVHKPGSRGFPTPPGTSTPKTRPGTGLSGTSAKLKNANRKEQEILLRREKLREEQPILSKAQTAA